MVAEKSAAMPFTWSRMAANCCSISPVISLSWDSSMEVAAACCAPMAEATC